jgi:hypothetical protein
MAKNSLLNFGADCEKPAKDDITKIIDNTLFI